MSLSGGFLSLAASEGMVCLVLFPERIHSPAHRGQEEPDGNNHHFTGVRRLHQRRDPAGNHPPAPGGAGRQRGHCDAAAGSRRSRQHEQQGATQTGRSFFRCLWFCVSEVIFTVRECVQCKQVSNSQEPSLSKPEALWFGQLILPAFGF